MTVDGDELRLRLQEKGVLAEAQAVLAEDSAMRAASRGQTELAAMHAEVARAWMATAMSAQRLAGPP